jgi:hypothetical protein
LCWDQTLSAWTVGSQNVTLGSNAAVNNNTQLNRVSLGYNSGTQSSDSRGRGGGRVRRKC